MSESETDKIMQQNGWGLLGSKSSRFVDVVIIRPYQVVVK